MALGRGDSETYRTGQVYAVLMFQRVYDNFVYLSLTVYQNDDVYLWVSS